MISAGVIREDILRMIHSAGSGHPGGSLSLVEILIHLYWKEMRIDPDNPRMINRDRLVLSKGHGAPALYSVLARRGFFPVEQLRSLREFGSGLQGHPHMQSLPGLDCSTGSLGHGLGIAAGMALGLSMRNNPGRVFCILGDGELQEGSVWESAMSVPALKQTNLTVVVDRNHVQLDDAVDRVMPVEPLAEKWKAFGWEVAVCNGHDPVDLARAFSTKTGKPLAIIAETVKGKGVSFMENSALWHGRAPDDTELQKALEELK
ncbi:transketolase [Candidatus Fermentibacteria bacterium]|nr:MAG: transketolase [Candidatus Fermentibacteria bacterium]